MGGNFSVEECTSPDKQHVRDCCHLEGETPIEIRIAYSQPRPSTYASSETGGRRYPPSSHQQQLANRLAAAQGFRAAPKMRAKALNAEKPRMPLGTENLRMPPARAPSADGMEGEFDAGHFSAPLDSERSSVMTPGRMDNPAALSMLQMLMEQEVDHFPEIVRAGRSGNRSRVPQVPPARSEADPAPADQSGGTARRPDTANAG
eukprot:TRINITY_DN106400_c0_g1_i1.p1 TRINITY_DN106400_c0_g1~~TRINITY_DN106400_c0_g1_i1.p1  ORF type:complete len:204 (+),score=29.78 TRINITY_DN106400_c0_g1_i1:62-673(+)